MRRGFVRTGHRYRRETRWWRQSDDYQRFAFLTLFGFSPAQLPFTLVEKRLKFDGCTRGVCQTDIIRRLANGA